ncbi:MAG: ABC transporter ATP-binding protein, partial [Candidatus Cloacimonetes bacterium]|nr:ABC transporter ATP-binding protein [Candidatus Cloacimonadota bacterium]
MRETFKFILPMLKKSAWRIALGVFIIFLVNAVQLIIPLIVKYVVDNLWKATITPKGLVWIALIIIGMAVLVYLFKYLWRMILIGNAWILERDLRQFYYDHLLSLSQNYFNTAKTGDLMARATNDLNAVRMLFGFGFIAFADTLFLSITSLFFMVNINLRLTLYAIIPL